MIDKLPGWIWPATWVMSAVAGMINVTGVLGFAHEAVTHLTGVTTQLGAALAGGNLAASLHLSGILVSFVAGAALCGLIVGRAPLTGRRRYGVAFVCETLLLSAAVPLLDHYYSTGVFLTCAAAGLQNGMVTAFSGSVVRTTHLSGLFTDLGLLTGQGLRGLPPNLRRWKLCLTAISGFLAGAIAGAAAFRNLGFHTLLIPAALTAAAGAGIFLQYFRSDSRSGTAPGGG